MMQFSEMTKAQILRLVSPTLNPPDDLPKWTFDAPPRPPSEHFFTMFRRRACFDLTPSHAVSVLTVDTVLLEVVPRFPSLKVWKGEPLHSETACGVVDFLIAPQCAYVDIPLLCCGVVAKKDDIEGGLWRCIAAMAACQENNRRAGHENDVHGFVVCNQFWGFCKLTPESSVHLSGLFTLALRDSELGNAPMLLGVLDFVCAACAKNVPQNSFGIVNGAR